MNESFAAFVDPTREEWLYRPQQESWLDSSILRVGLICLMVCAIPLIGDMVYNLYFHPLARFPGPWLARASLVWRITKSMQGRFHRCIDEGHKKYGPVFRVSPNELSFATKTAWRDIYGYKSEASGRLTHRKSKFYDIFASGYKTMCIGSEQDPRIHASMKKNLSPAFSNKAILDQELIIRQCVDRFVKKVAADEQASGKGVNMTRWWEIVTFDLFGEMAFGESFHAIEAGEPHFWPSVILDHLWFITVMDNLRRIPFLLYLGKKFLPWLTTATRDRHAQFTVDRLEQRLRNKSGRKDFLTHLVDQIEDGTIEKDEVVAHVSTMVIAGGETMSVTLGALTCNLLKTPEAYAKLVHEIRSAFNSYDSITASQAQQLPYLQAVIHETLRIHGPGSFGFPRLSPGAYVDGYWVPKGAEIYTSSWSVTHSDQYFLDPFTFRPERWLSPSPQDDLKASHPFSLGPRECVGKNFALVELSLLLACVIFEFDLELLDKDLDWEAESRLHVVWWKPAMQVRMTSRGTVKS